MASKDTQVTQRTWSVYEEIRPIFSGPVNTMADAYILAYAYGAGPWRQYAGDGQFVLYANPADDGVRKKVLKFSCQWTSYHLVAYFTGDSLTLRNPGTDRKFLELIYKPSQCLTMLEVRAQLDRSLSLLHQGLIHPPAGNNAPQFQGWCETFSKLIRSTEKEAERASDSALQAKNEEECHLDAMMSNELWHLTGGMKEGKYLIDMIQNSGNADAFPFLQKVIEECQTQNQKNMETLIQVHLFRYYMQDSRSGAA